MSSEDILPTYKEVMKTYQTPAHVLSFDSREIKFDDPSATTKIKAFLARPEHSSADDVHVKEPKKSRVSKMLVKALTARTPRRY